MTEAELGERMDAPELTRWMAKYQRAPFGDRRGDLQAAVVAHTVAMAFRGKGRHPKLQDYILRFDGEHAPAMSEAQMKANVSRIKANWAKYRKAKSNGQ